MSIVNAIAKSNESCMREIHPYHVHLLVALFHRRLFIAYVLFIICCAVRRCAYTIVMSVFLNARQSVELWATSALRLSLFSVLFVCTRARHSLSISLSLSFRLILDDSFVQPTKNIINFKWWSFWGRLNLTFRRMNQHTNLLF